jgi:fructose-1,6-bisphosphatase/inositol monophosphatase family enzyme
MILAVSLSILTGTLSGPVALLGLNLFNAFKKGHRSKLSNYRPVSLTSVASKILEHIIVSQIMDHLDNQNILNENQHGFRAKRSCERAEYCSLGNP